MQQPTEPKLRIAKEIKKRLLSAKENNEKVFYSDFVDKLESDGFNKEYISEMMYVLAREAELFIQKDGTIDYTMEVK